MRGFTPACAAALAFGFVAVAQAQVGPPVFINEIHYDNAGTDTGEAIEIAGPAGTSLAGWTVALYNGSGGAQYGTVTLAGTIPDQLNGFGTLNFDLPSNGLQNGAPDGLALVNASNAVVQFLSYEGSFTAAGGPAGGMTSTDIVVQENGSEPAGLSLQLTDTGTNYGDFRWRGPLAASPGAVNLDQVFGEDTDPDPPPPPPPPPAPPPGDVVVSQVYGGGGNSGATLTNDFIEIFNRSANVVSVTGWSVQYASAAGTTWQTTPLTGSIPPGGYFLVQQAAGAGGTTPLPTPDASGVIAMSATAGKVALVTNATALTGSGCPFAASVMDFVGYGSGATCAEGSAPTAAPSNTTSVARAFLGCNDTGNNSADFLTSAPNPRNSASPAQSCAPIELAIHEIQGNGSESPYADELVATTGIVTARKSNGFFIQTSGDADGDPATSQGVFVFTGGAPPAAAAVGNSVRVVGFVQEFVPGADVGSPPITEIAGPPVVTELSTGNPLPAAIVITAADTNPAGTIEQLERLEGMRVHVASLTVVAPTQGSVAEATASSVTNGVFYGVITGVARPFREPGIEVPDPLPPGSPCCVPRFDANPERLRVDSDGQPGAAPIDVATGMVVAGLTGPLDYSFRTYTILPDPPPATAPTVTGTAAASAVPQPAADEFTVASFNMERFFDTVNDPGIGEPVLTADAFERRLGKASLAIRNLLRTPDVLGVEEVENLSTLQAIAVRLNADAVAAGQGNPAYEAYLVEGNDVGGIDVGFLVKSARVDVIDVTQEGGATTFPDPDSGTPAILNDRPPLLLRARVQPASGVALPITVIVNHLRSLNGVDDPSDGNRVRTKRRLQAEFLANLIQPRQSERVISIGDYNAFQFSDGYVDSMGTIVGAPTAADAVVQASPDLVDPDLTNLVELADPDQRYSFSFDGNAQVLDHIVITESVAPLFRDFAYARNGADFPESLRNDATRPERLSDHDIPVAFFCLPHTPAVDASLTPVGPVARNHGQFEVGYTVANNCETEIDVNAVLAIPEGADGFRVIFRRTDDLDSDGDGVVDADASIIIDYALQRITLIASDEASVRALFDSMLSNGGAPVVAGQELRLQRASPNRFRFDYRDGVLLCETAPNIVLEVTATDSFGNTSVDTVSPVFRP